MVVNDAAYVRQVVVACFNFVLLEDGVEIVVCWEVLLDKVEQGLNDVSLYIFVVWGGGVHLFSWVRLCFSHLR